MKKWILIGVVVLAFGAFAIYQHVESKKSTTVATTTTTTTTRDSDVPDATNTASDSSTTSTTPSSTPATTTLVATAEYKDGTYTGSVANAFYGNLQVSATITGGKLADVQFLQYPNDRGESQQVNDRAMPLLKSEAITAQSAQVNVVSGATQSSHAFVESLGNALSQAKA